MNPIIPIFLITFFCCFLVLAQDKEPIIGIHFGEAFLSVAVHKGGNVIRIKNENGHLFTPSVVSFMENGDVIIGEEANKITNSQNTIYNIRSLLGKKKKELDSNLKSTLSFKLETDSDDCPLIQLRFNNGTLLHIPPKEIASILINKMRNLAETYLGHRVIESVISVPVYYTRIQKELIRQVIPHEGANYLINEPLLSIHAYGLSVPRVLVFILDNHLIQASIMEFNPAEKEYQQSGYYSIPCFEIFTSSFNMIDQEIRDNAIVERFKELITSKILRHVSLHSIDQIILLNPYLISDIELTISQYFGKKPLSSIQDPIVIGAAKIAHEYSLQSLRDLEKKLDQQEVTINSKSTAARNEF